MTATYARSVVRCLTLLIAWLACTLAWAAGYHPAEAGFSWTYDSGETQMLSGPRDFDGQQVMVLTHWFKGDAVSEDYLVYSPAGVQHVATAAGGSVVYYSPPLLAYGPGPFEVGSSWQSTARMAGLDITLSAEVVAVRGVSTGAGRFNAYQIRQVTVTSTGAQTVLDLYFVPSVGIVRFVMQDGAAVDLIEKNF
jgi:hypothetical protein